MNLVDIILFAALIVACPIGIYVFAGTRVTWDGIKDRLDRYRYHVLIILAVGAMKSGLLYVEERTESYATDYTPMMHGFEGNWVFWVQHHLESGAMTVFMAVIYLGSFLFIMVFSMALLCYMDERKAASKLGFLYLVLFFITVPFYLFVIVYVPSYPKMFYPGAATIVPGMEPLLYNISPRVNDFFMHYDSFNNCFPSLHIGYPVAVLLSLAINVRGFRGYKWFLAVLTVLISVSILYLGIHWLTDIIGGFLIAAVGVVITERYARRFWKWVHRIDLWTRKRLPFWPFKSS